MVDKDTQRHTELNSYSCTKLFTKAKEIRWETIVPALV